MSVTHPVLAHELSSTVVQSVAAIVYANEAYPEAIFEALVKRYRALGLSTVDRGVAESYPRRDDHVCPEPGGVCS